MKTKTIWKELELSPFYEVSQFGEVRSWRVMGSRIKVASKPKLLKTFFAGRGRGDESVRVTYKGSKYTFSIPKLMKKLFPKGNDIN